MAYIEPSTAANRSVDTLKDIRERNGPGSWRVPLAASPRARVLLYQWQPGTASEGHIHPDADELFVVHEGQASFVLDEGQVVDRFTFNREHSAVRWPENCLYFIAGHSRSNPLRTKR